MARRIIPCTVSNEYVLGAGAIVGAAGSGNDVALRLEFNEMWAGLTKHITWRDALGENPTVSILTTDLLEPGSASVYIVPIPPAPKAYEGRMSANIEGYQLNEDGSAVENATITTTAYFRVLPANYSLADDGSITPTIAQQMQAQLDTLIDEIAEIPANVEAAAESATAAEQSANAAAGNSRDAEAWANGTRNGVAVGEEDAAYQKHSRWWNALAEAAKVAAQNAAQSAQNTLASLVETANAKIAAAAAEVTQAKSWAVGGTGARQGEDTNNAKYWSEQAAAAAGGGVTSFNGRTGSVLPVAGDYTAAMVGTYTTAEINTLMQGFVAKETVFNADGSITETGADGSSKVTVFGEGVITETYTAGGLTATKTTTFNADGSITESVA